MKKNYIKYINIIFLLFISLSFCACHLQKKTQAIEPIHSFNEVNFGTIEPNTLVVFDVDETLTQPTDSYLINEHSAQAEAFKKRLFQEHPEVKDWNGLASLMLKEAPRPLIRLEFAYLLFHWGPMIGLLFYRSLYHN